MWENRRITILWASTACYRDSFTFFYLCSSWTNCVKYVIRLQKHSMSTDGTGIGGADVTIHAFLRSRLMSDCVWRSNIQFGQTRRHSCQIPISTPNVEVCKSSQEHDWSRASKYHTRLATSLAYKCLSASDVSRRTGLSADSMDQ
jgi:hypothetical protein